MLSVVKMALVLLANPVTPMLAPPAVAAEGGYMIP
jgi:hypothetical protein